MSRDPFDPIKAIERYHASCAGRMIPGDDDSFIAYRKKRRQKTLIVKATWSQVLIFALLNACAVSTAKELIYHYIGRPVLTVSDQAEVEQSYTRVAP